MKRHEIKFRAWDLKLKKYSYFNLGYTLPIYNNSEEFTIEQFTGVLDIYGTEIFEGDLVGIESYLDGKISDTYIVTYIEDRFLLKGNGLCNSPLFSNYRKIIGNIHENSNLLNGNVNDYLFCKTCGTRYEKH